MVADDVAVLGVMRQELRERALAMQRVEAADVERIANPIERRRLASIGPRLPFCMLRMILCAGS
jgi:hypothetical protein